MAVFGAILLPTVVAVRMFKRPTALLALLAFVSLLFVLVIVQFPPFQIFSEGNLIVALGADVILWLLLWKYYRETVSEVSQPGWSMLVDEITGIPNQGIIVTDDSGLIVAANRYVEELLGYKKNELLKRKAAKIFHFSNSESFSDPPIHYFLYYEQDSSTKAVQARRKDGSTIAVEITAKKIQTNRGHFRVSFIKEPHYSMRADMSQPCTDTDEIKCLYYDFAPVIFLALNPNGEVKTINKYGCELIAQAPCDVVSKNWFDHFVPDSDRDRSLEVFKDCVRTAGDITFKAMISDKDKHLKLIQWKCGFDPQTGLILFAGEDITIQESQHVRLIRIVKKLNKLKSKLEDRVRMRTRELENINIDLKLQIEGRTHIEDRLINSQRLYSAIAHNFPNGLIAVLDMRLIFMMIDGRELSALGFAQDELIGNGIFDGVDPLLDTSCRKHLESVLRGQNVTFEVTRSTSAYSVIAVPLYDQQNTIYGILLVMQNITESKNLEESLYKTIEQEKKLNELKSRFVTMASHEFRTPLTTILSSLFLLENYSGELYEEKKLIHIGRIKRTVNMLTETLNDFLRLGKLEEGKVEMILCEINIQDHVQDIMREMQSVAKPGQTIHYHHQGMNLNILLDKTLLRSIFFNLLSNAIKYSPDGSDIFIETLLSESQLRIEVIDRGIGIGPAERQHVFERFFRAVNAVNVEGTGLGLHIVKRYVELMRGDISFSSGDNGTTFCVTFPLQFTDDNSRMALDI